MANDPKPNEHRSQPNVIDKLQWWIDQPKDQVFLHPSDQRDRDQCLSRIAQIQSPSDSSSSTQVTRFRNPVLIGQGAFGMIFEADDLHHPSEPSGANSRVAIKWLKPSKKDLAIARKRFDSEIATIQSLEHPNIARVIEQGEVDGLPYFVTELADQGSLVDHLADRKDPMPHRQIAWLVMKIAEAVHTAHSSTIIHRDIKPGNVLLRTAKSHEQTEGLGLWPLLTDFGLAKDLEPQDARSNLTKAGEVLGTLRYMSPEQVRGEPLRTQSDIFALGILLYELLDGENPFDSSSDFGTRENIVKHPPKPLSNAESIPRDLRTILQRCLQKNAVDRYPSAVLLADDLEKFLEGRPVAGIQPSAWKQTLELIRLHPIASSVTLTGLLTVLISGLVFIYVLDGERRKQKYLKNEADKAAANERLAAETAKDSLEKAYIAAYSERFAADSAKEANQLFLESITIADNGINDSVISGQKVPPEALLQNLVKQSSLLEKAFAKDPANKKLGLHLQVINHYASLLYKILSDQSSEPESMCLQLEAIARRTRSLEIIGQLLADGPKDDPGFYQRRLRDRIVGEHWMGLIHHFDEKDQKESKKLWLSRSVEHLQKYLPNHPDDKAMISILNANRIELGYILLEEDSSEALKDFEDAYRYYDGFRVDGQLAMEPTSHALNALSGIARVSIRSSEPSEKAEAAIERCMRFCDENLLGKATEDWKYRDLWTGWLNELNIALYRSQRWDLLEKYARRWREYSESMRDWPGAEKGAGFRHSRESNIAAAAVYQLAALKHLERAEEHQRALEIFSQAWSQCTADPSFDPKSFWGMFENRIKMSPDDLPVNQ